MKFVTVTQVSALGKAAIGLIVSFGAVMQIPAVYAPITAFGHDHPHFASVIGVLTLLTTLLTNPQVQKVLNINLPEGAKADVKIENPAATPVNK